MTDIETLVRKFQFQIGAIGRFIPMRLSSSIDLFQFQIGAIGSTLL